MRAAGARSSTFEHAAAAREVAYVGSECVDAFGRQLDLEFDAIGIGVFGAFGRIEITQARVQQWQGRVVAADARATQVDDRSAFRAPL